MNRPPTWQELLEVVPPSPGYVEPWPDYENSITWYFTQETPQTLWCLVIADYGWSIYRCTENDSGMIDMKLELVDEPLLEAYFPSFKMEWTL